MISAGRPEGGAGGGSSSLELIRVEKLTHALHMFSKIDNLLETFVACMDEMK